MEDLNYVETVGPNTVKKQILNACDPKDYVTGEFEIDLAPPQGRKALLKIEKTPNGGVTAIIKPTRSKVERVLLIHGGLGTNTPVYYSDTAHLTEEGVEVHYTNTARLGTEESNNRNLSVYGKNGFSLQKTADMLREDLLRFLAENNEVPISIMGQSLGGYSLQRALPDLIKDEPSALQNVQQIILDCPVPLGRGKFTLPNTLKMSLLAFLSGHIKGLLGFEQKLSKKAVKNMMATKNTSKKEIEAYQQSQVPGVPAFTPLTLDMMDDTFGEAVIEGYLRGTELVYSTYDEDIISSIDIIRKRIEKYLERNQRLKVRMETSPGGHLALLDKTPTEIKDLFRRLLKLY